MLQHLSNSVSQYSPAPVVNIVPTLGRSSSNLNFPKNARTKMKVKNKRNFYQKQKRAMMATRIGFLTFFKLGWSNNVDSTPWWKGVGIGSR